jgi:putative methyltransferase (TIGR04325 family)
VSEGMRAVFDIGGATGIKALAFREGLLAALGEAGGDGPHARLRWTVQDVPAMVAEGRAQQAARGSTLHPLALVFTDQADDGRGQELLFASGVLQYLPETLAELVGRWPAAERPRRIVINTAALHPTTAYFTVNSLGTGFCAYRVQTQADLVRGLAALGYRPRESWANLGKVLELPGHAELSLAQYSGLCLDRAV